MIRKDEIELGTRVIQNDPEDPTDNPFKGTVVEILMLGDPPLKDFVVNIQLDEEAAEYYKTICPDGKMYCFPWQIDILDPADEMEEHLVLESIKGKIEKNKGEWDLTSDLGNDLLYDHQKSVAIRDLTINKDDEPAVIISLSYFSEDIIRQILKLM